MIKAPIPASEKERLLALQKYQVLDTFAEQAYDDITRIASAICETPIAVISLVDQDRQWFKSVRGLRVTETSRDVAFCAHAILQPDLFVVNDALADERFFDNPLVTGGPCIRFYAGAPLENPEGLNLGTLCVIDTVPKELTDHQSTVLTALSRQVMLLLELRYNLQKMTALTADLEVARQTAVELARAKADFLAGMSHEIRTPMNGVIGMTNLLLETKLDEDQKDFAQTIQSSAMSLLTIVNDILDFSKMDAGRMSIEAVPFNLKSLLGEIEKTFSVAVAEKGIKLQFEPFPLNHLLIGDPTRIKQILLNLINNAIKFTHEGEVTLKLDVKPSAEKQVRIRLSVADSGIGIPEEALSKIFNDFVQVDASTTRKFGGTGLGLSICKKLVQLMGGKIGVSSTVDVGSTFWFELEFPVGHSLAELRSPELSEVDVNPLTSGRRILVAEDNTVNQKIVLRTLEKLGYEAVIASNGFEVLRALESEAFDLILMDVQMPVMDGLQATQKVRETHPDLPIIALTANALSGDEENCLAVGMNDYLTKPFKIEQLSQKLKRWLA